MARFLTRWRGWSFNKNSASSGADSHSSSTAWATEKLHAYSMEPRPKNIHVFVPEFLLKPLRPYLRAILDTRECTALVNNALYVMQRESLLVNERNRDPKRLLAQGFRGYSQHDEDGMIQEIFRRIGLSKQVFVEFGVGDGTENNTLYLMLSGWRGLWIDGSQANAAAIHARFSSFIQTGQLSFVRGFVDRDSINGIIEKAGHSGDIDLLSIDIDGNDYWVWEVISVVKPRVVVIEYNPYFARRSRSSPNTTRILSGRGQATTERVSRPSKGSARERVTRLSAARFRGLMQSSSNRIWSRADFAHRSPRRTTSSRLDSDSTKQERSACTQRAWGNTRLSRTIVHLTGLRR
jgi:hypothetical protein